jgi:hypothetical protein
MGPKVCNGSYDVEGLLKCGSGGEMGAGAPFLKKSRQQSVTVVFFIYFIVLYIIMHLY